MAVLVNADRAALMAEWMRVPQGSVAIIKTDLRAAIDAIDQWVSDNQASFNTALPVAARNNLTAAQKASLLMYVVEKRFASGV